MTKRKKTGKQTGIGYHAMFPKDIVENLITIAEEEDRSVTSQIRYFVKQGIKKYANAHNLICPGCGEISPVCYCDILDDNRKDTL